MGRAGKGSERDSWKIREKSLTSPLWDQTEPAGESGSLAVPAAGVGPQRSAGGNVSDGCCLVSGHGPGTAAGQPGWQLEGKTDHGRGSCEEKIEIR